MRHDSSHECLPPQQAILHHKIKPLQQKASGVVGHIRSQQHSLWPPLLTSLRLVTSHLELNYLKGFHNGTYIASLWQAKRLQWKSRVSLTKAFSTVFNFTWKLQWIYSSKKQQQMKARLWQRQLRASVLQFQRHYKTADWFRAPNAIVNQLKTICIGCWQDRGRINILELKS